MTWNVLSRTVICTLTTAVLLTTQVTQAAGPAEQAVAEAAKENQFAFILFFKANDAATQQMHETLTTTLADRTDATIVPVHVADAQEAALVKQFDATRLPMPAVAILAPNGAVCSVIPRQISEQQALACIVSPIQATCLKTLQDNQLVALCVLPSPQSQIPAGVAHFKQDAHYSERTRVIPVLAGDPQEAKFLKQLKIPTDKKTPVVAFIAPPGVMVGMFDERVTANELASKLAAAGKCCDDENCKHNQTVKGQTAKGAAPTRR
ncbi:MAG: hypothetical protein CMJ46_04315 [Planctomyces sp.]|nr:hypothetical protein [Planctomyces sp.]